jgi:hypothetical protein
MFFFARLKIEKTQNAGAQQIIRKQQLNIVSMKLFLQKGRMASLSLGTI